MPENKQEQQSIDMPPLDPNRILARLQKYNPDLYGRIIAEEQRDQLAQIVQQLSQQPAAVTDEVKEDGLDLTKVDPEKDAA